ncbi:MAG: hypothetical protein ACFCU3_03720 [Verrucomicrobiales bacterium]
MTETILTKRAVNASRQFIETTARPLEIARFRYAFDDAPAESVFNALKQYQNSDGGFGQTLEPDLRARESSVLCTTIAFQVLRSTQTNPDPSLIASAMAYFLNTFQEKAGHWRIIPVSAEQSAHAPWWNQTGREDTFDSFSLNPTAEILGYLYDHQDLVPAELLLRLSKRVILNLSELEKIEMHDLLCCLRLLQTRTLPEPVRGQLHQKLADLVNGAVSWDPTQWKGYCLRPLQVIDDPQSPFLAGREESLRANLDYEIASQNDDGSWTPTWTWGDAWPDDWTLARREWAGVITLEKLMLLQRFNRIEGSRDDPAGESVKPPLELS